MKSSHNDEELVMRVADGDKSAFSLLYDRYANMIYTMAFHTLGNPEAEEVLQEVFLRLWDKASQFDAERGSFASWLTAITRNYLRDRLGERTAQSRMVMAEEIYQILSERLLASDMNVEDEFTQRERQSLLQQGLLRLPEEQRKAIILSYFSGLSHTAIAKQLNLPLGTVKKRIKLGMEKLRLFLVGKGLKVENTEVDRDE